MALSKEQIAKLALSHGEELEEINKKLKTTDTIMVGIIVVLFIGFTGMSVALGGMIVDAFRSREGAYQDLTNKVNSQQIEIDNTNSNVTKIKSYFGIK
jgi:hypothetical protein